VLTCHVFRDGVMQQDDGDASHVAELLKEDGVRVWIDAQEPTDDELELLRKQFSLHPLSIEDVVQWNQRSKIEVFDTYFAVVVHALQLVDEDVLVDSEIHMFAGASFLITVRASPPFDLRRVRERIHRSPELIAAGASFFLYALLDEVVDGYLQIVERYEDVSDDIEDDVFRADDEASTAQQRIFALKRRVVQFRRIVVPLREVIDFVQEQPDFVPPPLVPYYRDVLDHLLRSIEFVDNIRDLLTSALEAQLAQVSNRLNVVMKKLSSWAGIVLVPTLIAGIYGMNFRVMPELDWAWGYPLALALMGASAFGLYRAFKKRDWL
jgi:magnesium transporter